MANPVSKIRQPETRTGVNNEGELLWDMAAYYEGHRFGKMKDKDIAIFQTQDNMNRKDFFILVMVDAPVYLL